MVNPPRDFRHKMPCFKRLFTFQNNNPSPISGSCRESSVERIEPEVNTSKFEVTLSLAEREGRLIGSIEYDADLFERARHLRPA